MLFRVIFFLLGYLEVLVSGKRPERFVNLALANNIYFWNVRWSRDGLRLYMGLWAFRGIRSTARRARCRVRIVSKRGLPFLLKRAAARRVLAAGGVALIALFYAVTSFVWFIEIHGLKTVERERVLLTLGKLGLYPGVYKGSLDLDQIASRLTAEMNELGWAGIHARGTKVIVEVAERSLLLPSQRPDEAPGDIVASKDGVVESILVLRGEGLVRPGDTVRQGQVLIKGLMNPWIDGEAGSGSMPVRARGVIKARVWYDLYVEVPLRQDKPVRTGRSWSRMVVRLAGKNIIIRGFGGVPFKDYQLEESVVRPEEWRKTVFPVEFITQLYYEVKRQIDTISEVEAIKRAEAEARRKMMRRIPVSARIHREDIRVVQRNSSFIGLRMTVEAEEDIGVFGRR